APGRCTAYVEGPRPALRVPMRLSGQPPAGAGATPPIPVYDTAGPYSDPDVQIDLRRGLPSVRGAWIDEREDTEVLDGPSSAFGRERLADPATAPLRFEHRRRPRRAKPGRCVTQMHYARRGEVTPELEFRS